MTEGPHFVDMANEPFVKEAVQIVQRAKSNNVCLRILGALAVYIRSLDKSECMSAFASLERLGEGKPLFTDVDLAGYRKQRKQIVRLFHEMHFKPMNIINAVYGDKRLIYTHPEGKYQADVFLNKLEFSHDVHFGEEPGKGRLELSSLTIDLADIVLEKLQIHMINRKDLIDLLVLFLGHDVRNGEDGEAIDGQYIGGVLAKDWGFWYDAMTNLGRVKALVADLVTSGKIVSGQADVISGRIDNLKQMVDSTPKTKDWEKRAKIGTSKPWYREVDEVAR